MSGLFGGGGQYEGPSEQELASERALEIEKIKMAQAQEMSVYEAQLRDETIAQENALQDELEANRSLLSEKLLADTNRAKSEANRTTGSDDRKRINLLQLLEGEDGNIPVLGSKDAALSAGKDSMFRRQTLS